MPPRFLQRLLRLNVRMAMAFIAVVGMGLGWLVSSSNAQRDAVAAIQRAGGRVAYDCDPRGLSRPRNGVSPTRKRQLWAPGWLVDRVGIDYFSHPVMVTLPASGSRGDRALTHVGRLRRLDTLIVYSEISAADSLAPLEGMAALKRLELYDTKVGDAGLRHLKSLKGLKILRLDKAGLTDAGLDHLKDLVKLEYLSLQGTAVTDAGLAHLSRFTELKQLDLGDTQVTLDGLALKEFHERLPKVRITDTFGIYGVE